MKKLRMQSQLLENGAKLKMKKLRMQSLGIEAFGRYLSQFNDLETILLKSNIREKTVVMYFVDGIIPEEVQERIRADSYDVKSLEKIKEIALQEIISHSAYTSRVSFTPPSSTPRFFPSFSHPPPRPQFRQPPQLPVPSSPNRSVNHLSNLLLPMLKVS